MLDPNSGSPPPAWMSFLLSSTYTDYAIASQSSGPQSQGAQCCHKPEACSSRQGIPTISCSSEQRESAGERTDRMDIHGKVMEAWWGQDGGKKLSNCWKTFKALVRKRIGTQCGWKVFMKLFIGHFAQVDYQSHEKHETPTRFTQLELGTRTKSSWLFILRKIDSGENNQAR